MASNEKDSPISLLETLSEIDGNLEYFAVAKDGTTYKCTPAQLKDFVLKGETPVVRIPLAVLNLSNSSSSEDILNAFGGKDAYNGYVSKITQKSVIKIGDALYAVSQVLGSSYTDENNSQLVVQTIAMNVIKYIQVTVTGGTAKAIVGKWDVVDAAPTDGKAYGRKNGDWAEVSDKKYVDDSISSARSVGYMMQLTEIDATGLDENTWYPVTIAAGERMNIRVEVLVSLDSGTKPSWSQHERGFSTRKIWEFVPNVWGVNRDSNITIYLSDFVHADIDPVRGLGNLSHFDTCYVFVRGGGKYHFYASHEAKVILHTDTYAPGDQSVSPTTETPAAIVENIATKEYVDSYHYGKSLKIPNVETVLHPTSLQGQDAQSKIDDLFGGAESFKAIVEDILTKHTRYYFHFDDNFTNCLELGCVNAWRSNERTSYELHFIVVYNTNNIYYTSRIGVIYNVDVNATKYYVAHLVQSDNLTTLTKKTAAEYEAIGSKDGGTMYAITDA